MVKILASKGKTRDLLPYGLVNSTLQNWYMYFIFLYKTCSMEELEHGGLLAQSPDNV
jgi:hypothetical protein